VFPKLLFGVGSSLTFCPLENKSLCIFIFANFASKQQWNRTEDVRWSKTANDHFSYGICEATSYRLSSLITSKFLWVTYRVHSEIPPQTQSHLAQRHIDAKPTTSSGQWRQEGGLWLGPTGCCTGGGRRGRSLVWCRVRHQHWTCGLKESETHGKKTLEKSKQCIHQVIISYRQLKSH